MARSVPKEINELKTIRDWIRWGVSQLRAANVYYGHGTDNAWDEAVTLVLHTLHLPSDIDTRVLEARLTSMEKQAVQKILQRRIHERLPAPYLTNEAWFAGLPFYVDTRVLIPRSPMAELIEQAFQPWIAPERVQRILDLCTGSGCLAIACAKAFPHAQIVATDISADALAVAKINVEKHQVSDQMSLVKSDLFQQLRHQQFDIIISNPPYVDAEDMATLPAEYLHEPALALAAGQDGLTVVKNILAEAANYLNDKGILIVEAGNSAGALCEQFPALPFTWLEFERGEGEVFLLAREQLINFSSL